MSKNQGKQSDQRAPYKSGVPTPKARPKRQQGAPEHPKGGPHHSTRGGARRNTAKDREVYDRGETPREQE